MKKIGDLFASRHQTRLLQNITGDRHGRPWTPAELDSLERWFKQGHTLEQLIEKSGRSSGGVLPKLMAAHLIEQPNGYYTDYQYAIDLEDQPEQPQPENQPENQPEPVMSQTIENITFIQGQAADQKTDDQIFALIAKLEQEANSLKNIKNKPKKLEAKIASIEDDIQKLCDFVDNRE